MSATERDLLYRAKFQDDVTAGLTIVDSAIKETGNSVKKTTAAIDPMANAIAEIKRREEAWKEEVFKLRDAVQKQTESFQLRAEALRDPATMRAVQEQQRLRQEIELLTRSTKTEEQEITALNTAMADNLIRLERQRNLVANPGYQAAMREEAKLKKEIADITKAALPTAEREAEVIGITTRQRRELIVAMREVMRGNFTQLSGTAMVLEEGKGGITGALKAAVEMMGGPYVVAAGGAALATAGVAAAMWKASEASAEMWHHMELLGKEEGVSAQTMLGFQYMATGTGVSVDQLGKAFATFTEKLGSHSAKMRELGITAQDPIQAFEQLMEIIKSTADATQRDALAKETLGAGWKKLIPVLEQGKAGAEAAMAAMQIPPETAAAYERANDSQIRIDKSWVAIKAHSGEAFAGIRAGFKDAEAAVAEFFASVSSHEGEKPWLDRMLNSYFYAKSNGGGAVSQAYKIDVQETIGKSVNSMQMSGYAEYMNSKVPHGLTDEEKDLQKEALGVISKNDLAVALAEEKKNYSSHRALVMGEHKSDKELDSDHYQLLEQLSRAHQMRMKEIRDQFARKSRPKAEKISRVGADLDTMYAENESGEYKSFRPMDQSSREAALKRGHDADLAYRKSEMAAEANAQKIQLAWIGALSSAQRKAHDEHVAQITKEADLVQGFASRELSQMIQGKMTWKSLEADATAFLADQIAERTTKWIENQILESVFAKEEAASSLAATQLQAAATAAAWAPAAMSASIATFGSASATGSAAYFNALAAGNIAATMTPHARGGMVFGPALANREETMVPFQPGRIVPAYNSTSTTHNNYGGNSIVVHIHGGDEKRILRTIRNATMDGRQSYR